MRRRRGKLSLPDSQADLSLANVAMEGALRDLKCLVDEFRNQGYCVLKKAFSNDQIAGWKTAYDSICARQGELVWVANALELDPHLYWPAITQPDVLHFLEAVMGPFLQLDGISINGFPSKPAEHVVDTVNGWHRDRYATVPETCDYVRPLACNAIFYLQDIDDSYGPLRVVPGSHRLSLIVSREGRTKPRQDELLLYPKRGDVVVTHCQLLHSGTPNISGQPRYFMAANYNQSWMKHRDRFDGPKTRSWMDQLRQARDRRGLRLLGEDAQMWDRTNPYWFTGSEQERWRHWIAEDQSFQDGGDIVESDLNKIELTTKTVDGASDSVPSNLP